MEDTPRVLRAHEIQPVRDDGDADGDERGARWTEEFEGRRSWIEHGVSLRLFATITST